MSTPRDMEFRVLLCHSTHELDRDSESIDIEICRLFFKLQNCVPHFDWWKRSIRSYFGFKLPPLQP